MNVAFVKDSKHNVDGDDGGQDQHGFRRERILKDLRCSLETSPNRVRHIDGPRRVLDNLCRLQERSARIQIKREGDRGELTLMIYRSRSVGGLNMCDGAKRNLDASRAGNVNFVKGGGICEILRRSFEDDMELVTIIVHDRNLPLTESTV
jgi:hypothetical protein